MLFTNRDLTKIIVPLIIEQILAVTIGMLDTVMVAQAGEAAVSGVSLVDSVNLLMLYIFSALLVQKGKNMPMKQQNNLFGWFL